MGAVKELWMIEYEAIQNDWDKDHDDDLARRRLRKLGFEEDEIEEHIQMLHS